MPRTTHMTLHLNVETHDKLQRLCSGTPGWTPSDFIRSLVEGMEPHFDTMLDALDPTQRSDVAGLNALDPTQRSDVAGQLKRPRVVSARVDRVCEGTYPLAWCCECGRARPYDEVMAIPWDGRFVCYSCCDS
jgi:hypothetical protein